VEKTGFIRRLVWLNIVLDADGEVDLLFGRPGLAGGLIGFSDCRRLPSPWPE